jgi:gluconolactonase
VEKVTDVLYKPNGICFSPDYKKLYIADTGASHYEKAPKNIMVFEVVDGVKLGKGTEYTSMKMQMKVKVKRERGTDSEEKAGFADGIRADVDGNIWVGAGWVGEGCDGVHIFAPDGERIGLILLPEIFGTFLFTLPAIPGPGGARFCLPGPVSKNDFADCC